MRIDSECVCRCGRESGKGLIVGRNCDKGIIKHSSITLWSDLADRDGF